MKTARNRIFPALLWLGLVTLAPAQVIEVPQLELVPTDEPIRLNPMLVDSSSLEEDYDPTGMDGPEVELGEPPFSNDFLGVEGIDEGLAGELDAQVQLASGASPVDLAAGSNRLNIKGFPTPRLRNGFTQVGIPEVLNTERVATINGPFVPVTGRAAPGGIQNHSTARPRGKPLRRVEAGATSLGQIRLGTVTSGELVKKKLWQHFLANWSQRHGSDPFSYDRRTNVSGTLTWRINRKASTMLQLDYEDRRANPQPNILEYRPTATAKIVGPRLPLADIHAGGPNAGLRKRTFSASVQFEGQISKLLSLRAVVQWLERQLDEDRWKQGQYLLDTGKLNGVREPQHLEQPFSALVAQVDATARFNLAQTDHKVTFSVESANTRYRRTQLALETADRDLLPVDVRTFDPLAPNYDRPAFDPALYRRRITDRSEEVGFTGLVLSERAAFARGRFVATAGVRQDFVDLEVVNFVPGNARPVVTDRKSQFSQFLGANLIAIPNRLLAFANTSTAFEPSTRVDARTGRVQGNETTLGYEAGAKLLLLDRRLSVTGLGFTYYNRNIARRNPLYDDPVADANQTQPQLVSAGEERFSGGNLEVIGNLTPELRLTGRATYTRAITTKSPDLPEEIGRPLSRLPRFTGGFSARYKFAGGALQNLSLGAQITWVSGYVASYENVNREYLAYPGYHLVGLSAGYRWKTGRREHNVGLSVRNAFDRDLVALVARTNQGRDFGLSYALTF